MVKKKVLPFLDLQILSEYHHIKIPNHVIGRLLLPDEDHKVELSERVRKLIQPLTEELISESVQETLSAAARSWFYSKKQNKINPKSGIKPI